MAGSAACIVVCQDVQDALSCEAIQGQSLDMVSVDQGEADSSTLPCICSGSRLLFWLRSQSHVYALPSVFSAQKKRNRLCCCYSRTTERFYEMLDLGRSLSLCHVLPNK